MRGRQSRAVPVLILIALGLLIISRYPDLLSGLRDLSGSVSNASTQQVYISEADLLQHVNRALAADPIPLITNPSVNVTGGMIYIQGSQGSVVFTPVVINGRFGMGLSTIQINGVLSTDARAASFNENLGNLIAQQIRSNRMTYSVTSMAVSEDGLSFQVS